MEILASEGMPALKDLLRMPKGSVLAALTLGFSTWVFWTETLMMGAVLTPLQ